MNEALFYQKLEDQKVKCTLCPHDCIIKEGQRGVCGVRKNARGVLYSENYGQVTALGFDPIEKKPLYHFHPGDFILSIGSFGCNFKCHFCQNWEISQTTLDDITRTQTHTANDIVEAARGRKDNIGIAYTYNEPVIYYEFMLDTAQKAHQQGLKNVMVTNGFINREPLEKLIPWMDAFSVDLKGFTDAFYRKNTRGRLDPILEALKTIADSGKFLEITNLVIPTLNDQKEDFEEMIKWIRQEIGKKTVLHISRYFPGFHSQIGPTPLSTLKNFHETARKYLSYVYLGNVNLKGASNTYCDKCGKLLVTREGYYTELSGIDEEGKCLNCKNKVFVR